MLVVLVNRISLRIQISCCCCFKVSRKLWQRIKNLTFTFFAQCAVGAHWLYLQHFNVHYRMPNLRSHLGLTGAWAGIISSACCEMLNENASTFGILQMHLQWEFETGEAVDDYPPIWNALPIKLYTSYLHPSVFTVNHESFRRKLLSIVLKQFSQMAMPLHCWHLLLNIHALPLDKVKQLTVQWREILGGCIHCIPQRQSFLNFWALGPTHF